MKLRSVTNARNVGKFIYLFKVVVGCNKNVKVCDDPIFRNLKIQSSILLSIVLDMLIIHTTDVYHGLGNE